ncbi:11619_t:CDS:2, partial [Funneliformis geosporum]
AVHVVRAVTYMLIYDDLIENSGNANYMVSKAILTPKNINVEIISDIIMKRILGEDILYSSADLVNLPDDNLSNYCYDPEDELNLNLMTLYVSIQKDSYQIDFGEVDKKEIKLKITLTVKAIDQKQIS